MKLRTKTSAIAALAGVLCCPMPGRAEIPHLIRYQGRIVVNNNGNGNGPGTNFNGTGDFRFSLVDGTGTTVYWENDPVSTNTVELELDGGLYSVVLGDTSILHMAALPADVFENEDVRLRVEFDDGTNGLQTIDEDIRIVSVGYAFMAGNVVDGAITADKLAPGAVGLTNLNVNQLDNRYVESDGDEMSAQTAFSVLNVTNTSILPSTVAAAISGRREGADNGFGIRGEHGGAGTGVSGVTEGFEPQITSVFAAIGVHGSAIATAGLNVGVFGDSESPDGFAGYFQNKAIGGVGLYAAGGGNDAFDIVAGGNNQGRISSNPLYSSSDLWLQSNQHLHLVLDNDNSGEDADFTIERGDGSILLAIDESGATGLKRPDESQILRVSADGRTELYSPDGLEFAQIQRDAAEGGGEITLRNSANEFGILMEANETAGTGAQISLHRADGTQVLTLDADFNGSSRVITDVIEIRGGSDLSEQFEISNGESDLPPEPGMIVSIDPERPGHLRPSSRAYESTVAGIISGAGGVRPGLLMGQRDSIADGAHPVALTGRVYCYVDASYGAIKPGDFITSSDTPGHGMLVTDHQQAQGAILGKAMTSLEEGTGLVLVLVSLQ